MQSSSCQPLLEESALYAAHVTSRFAALLTRFDATLTAHLPQLQDSLRLGLTDTVLLVLR